LPGAGSGVYQGKSIVTCRDNSVLPTQHPVLQVPGVAVVCMIQEALLFSRDNSFFSCKERLATHTHGPTSSCTFAACHCSDA
jgi:hypothetical protein